MLFMVFFGLGIFPAGAAFTSFYVFGDSLSTVTNNSVIAYGYYGNRYSNGRVWVEVLAQRLGLTFNLANNTNAFWGNTSSNLVGEVNSYVPPPDASNALVVIWVNNADLYFPASDQPPTLTGFNTVISQAQTNHYYAITNLYAKGIRNLVMPNVVDISTIPAFNSNPGYKSLFHQASTNYNAVFYTVLNQARTNCPGLTIYVPDYFALLTNLMAYPASYGVTNALQNGVSIDALAALGNPSLTNGPGTNYIFWDYIDPTALVHSIMASVAQQLIAPVQLQLNRIVPANGSNQLVVVNMPIGMNGFVLSTTNLTPALWLTNSPGFTSQTNMPSISVPIAGPQQFYRLYFPWQWSWP